MVEVSVFQVMDLCFMHDGRRLPALSRKINLVLRLSNGCQGQT